MNRNIIHLYAYEKMCHHNMRNPSRYAVAKAPNSFSQETVVPKNHPHLVTATLINVIVYHLLAVAHMFR